MLLSGTGWRSPQPLATLRQSSRWVAEGERQLEFRSNSGGRSLRRHALVPQLPDRLLVLRQVREPHAA
jgi:hypothetical protein